MLLKVLLHPLDFAQAFVEYLSEMFGAPRWITVVALVIFFLAHAFLWFVWDMFFSSMKSLITG